MACSAHLHELKNPEVFGSWFYRIVKTQALRSLRRGNPPSSIPLDRHTDPTSVEDGVVLQLDLKDAIDALPVELSHVFVLIVVHDWPLRDAAHFLDIPIGTVKSRLTRARAIIQERVAEHVAQVSDADTPSWDLLLRELRRGAGPSPAVIRAKLAQSLANVSSARFLVHRDMRTRPDEMPRPRQTSTHLWKAPNSWRIESTSSEIGHVILIVRGRRMYLWDVDQNTSESLPMAQEFGPENLVTALWSQFLDNNAGLTVLPPDEATGNWHFWKPIPDPQSDTVRSLHLWVDPSDGMPQLIELWDGDGWVYREQMEQVECNVPIKESSFTLPSSVDRKEGPTLSELKGGMPTFVDSRTAVDVSRFNLKGIDRERLIELGIQVSLQVSKYYEGRVWAARYGPPMENPAVDRAVMRGERRVVLAQAESVSAEFERHWGIDTYQDPVPELGPEAKGRTVVLRNVTLNDIYWIAHKGVYHLNGVNLSLENLVVLAQHLVSLEEQLSRGDMD